MARTRHWLRVGLNWAVGRIRGFAYAPQRPFGRARLGLALGSGFARGLAHIGVLKVFQENNIPVDCLAGTSVGSLIAAAYSSGMSLRAMEEEAAKVRFRDFARWTISRMGLATNERMEQFIHRLIRARTFEDLQIPCAVVTTDLATGEPVIFTQGELVAPLRASCAVPGLFLPIQHAGHALVDGALVGTVPTRAVAQLGAEIIVAVWLDAGHCPEPQPPRNLLDVVGQSFSIAQRQAMDSWRQLADVVLEPHVVCYRWDDFERAHDIILAGEHAARLALPRLRDLLRRGARPTLSPRAGPVANGSWPAKNDLSRL